MKENKNLIVFDLDGTLSQSNLFSLPAIQDTQKALGYEPTDYDTLLHMYGAPFNEFLEVIFPGANEDIVPKYKEQVAISERKFKDLAKGFDGIKEMLKSLKSAGYYTAVCSNSNIEYITFVLESINIIEHIDYIQQLEETMKSKSESLNKLISKVHADNTIMIGDTSYDYLAAKDNNVDFIGCLYGFRPEEMATVEYSVEHPDEIFNTVRCILSKKHSI